MPRTAQIKPIQLELPQFYGESEICQKIDHNENKGKITFIHYVTLILGNEFIQRCIIVKIN